MGEIRKDYILDRYVIIATERATRPDQFMENAEPKKADNCYFCPGKESQTPPEIMRVSDGEKWKIRVFPNKFAAVRLEGYPHLETHNKYYTFASAFGYHEVIVETPDHDKILADLPAEHISEILKVYANRIKVLSAKEGINYVSVFKNHGKDAGTSLVHTHSQVIAYNVMPAHILEEETVYEERGYDVYGDIIRSEKDSFRRVAENGTAVCFTPYASRFPLEAWIFPKRYVRNITEFDEQEYLDFARILKGLLVKLQSINASYNFDLHYGLDKLRFHLELLPRLTKWAGFEHSTGTIINVVTPEDAAKFYRE
jgi:UDPglucose--hexose-1-phosphate uridylyltransferase